MSLSSSAVSLPLWKCGLKSINLQLSGFCNRVTSLVEVWIEITRSILIIAYYFVTSLVEVWIEILNLSYEELFGSVTSLVEVWIEIRKHLS